MNVGDEVTINGTVVYVTESGNPIVKLNSGYKFLVRQCDINTERPKIETPEKETKETPLFREKEYKK